MQGCDAYGIAPWDDARKIATELADRPDVSFDIRDCAAENSQFGEAYFDLVRATSAMEHVKKC